MFLLGEKENKMEDGEVWSRSGVVVILNRGFRKDFFLKVVFE